MEDDFILFLHSILLSTLSYLPPFLIGYASALFTDWWKNKIYRKKLLKHLKSGCENFLETFVQPGSDEMTTPIVLFPEIDQVIQSGHIQHFPRDIQTYIFRISELKRINHEMHNILMQHVFPEHPNPHPSNSFRNNFSKYSEDLRSTTQKLFDLLNNL